MRAARPARRCWPPTPSTPCSTSPGARLFFRAAPAGLGLRRGAVLLWLSIGRADRRHGARLGIGGPAAAALPRLGRRSPPASTGRSCASTARSGARERWRRLVSPAVTSSTRSCVLVAVRGAGPCSCGVGGRGRGLAARAPVQPRLRRGADAGRARRPHRCPLARHRRWMPRLARSAHPRDLGLACAAAEPADALLAPRRAGDGTPLDAAFPRDRQS